MTTRRLSRRSLLVLVIASASGLLSFETAHAQPAPPLPEPGIASDESNLDGSISEQEPLVRRVYVPQSELNSLLQQDNGSVLLSRDEFRKLWFAAKKAEESSPQPPADLVLSAADYMARVEGEQMMMSADIAFTQFASGWQVLRLPAGGLSVLAATVDGESAAVSRDPQASDTLLVFSNTEGTHRLTLELSATVNAVGSDSLIEFSLPGAPSGTLHMSLPEDKSLTVDGLATSRTGDEYSIPVGGKSHISLRVSEGEATRSADDLLFARTAYGLRVSPGEVTWNTNTTLTAYGRTLDRLQFTVPRELDVVSVESLGLASWDMNDADDGDRTELTLTYRQPFDGTRDVIIRGVFVPEEEWSVPTLLLDGTDAHVGTILVQHDPDLRLQPTFDDTVRPATADELQATDELPARSSESGPTMGFHAMQPEFELSFFTPRKKGTVQVAMTNLLQITDDGLDLSSILDVQASVAPLFDLRVMLPAEFEVNRALVAGQPVEWRLGSDEVGRIEVRIPLDPPLHPGESRRVDLTAHSDPEDWPVENNSVLLTFPEVGLPQADMVEARYAITASEDLGVETVELTGLDPARGEQAEALKRLLEPLGLQLRLGFTYQDTEFSGQLDITRRPARLSTSTFLLSRLEPQQAVTRVRASVTVEGGGLEGLLIKLPEEVDSNARFVLRPPVTILENTGQQIVLPDHLVTIVEQTVSEPIDGERTWTLRFDKRLKGTHELTALLMQPRTTDGEVTLPMVTFTGADRQNGWIAVEARDDQRLTVRAADVVGQPLQAVDPIDLPGMAADDAVSRRIVGGFRFSRAGASATVSEEQFDRAVVPTAVVDRLDMKSVLGEAGDVQHRLLATFRAVGVQNMLVALPDGAELWSVQVDDQPIEVREATHGYQVPLPATDTPAAERSLQVFYRTNVGELGHVGHLQQIEPQLAIQHGNGETQPIDILSRDWSLDYPQDVVLLDSDGTFTPSVEMQDDTFFGHIRESITLPSWEALGWRLATAVAGAILVWIVIRTTRNQEWAMSAIAVAIVTVFVLAVMLPAINNVRYSTRVNDMAVREKDTAQRRAEEAMGVNDGGALRGGTRIPIEPPMESQLDAFGEYAASEASESEEIAQQAPIPATVPSPDFNLGIQDLDPSMATDGLPQEESQAQLELEDSFDFIGQIELPVDAPSKPGGALLSLSIDLETPERLREVTFTSLGSRRESEVPAIDVTYASRSSREVLALIVAAGVMLLMWWARLTGPALRIVLVVFTIIVPLALVMVVPSLSSMIVEGVLLGGLLGLILWAVRATVMAVTAKAHTWRSSSASTKPVVTSLLMLACLTTTAGDLQADEVVESKTLIADVEEPDGPDEDELPTVIIPYGDGNPFDADRVLLDRTFFDLLRQQASPEVNDVGPAPIDGVVAEANYEVHIDAEQPAGSDAKGVGVSAKFIVNSFRDVPVALHLPLSQVAVESAQLDEAPGIVRPTDDGGLEVVVPDRGSHVLVLEFRVPADLQATSGEFTLPLHPVAAGRLAVTLPSRDDWTINVQRDGRDPIGYQRQTNDQGVSLAVPIDRGGRVTVAWQPEQVAGGREGIVQVESKTAVQVDDAGASLRGAYDITVRQGNLSRVLFRFPESVRLKRVWGADVGGWQIDGDGDDRTLTVFLGRTVDDRTLVFADLFLPEAGAGDEVSFDMPDFSPQNITRESGQIVFLTDDQREIRVNESTGITRTNGLTGELPEELNPDHLPIQGTYRFTSRPWSLSLSAALRASESRAIAEYGMFVSHRKILLGARLQFDLAGAPRRLLTTVLPHDFLMVDLRSPDVQDWFVEDGELVLDLGQPRLGRVTVTFEGHIQRDATDTEAVLETPLLQNVDRLETTLAVWMEDGLTGSLEGFEGWRSVQAGDLSPELRALHHEPVQFAFRTTALEPELIILLLNRAQPRLACDAVSLVAVSDSSLDYGLTLRWSIERAAADQLIFTTDGWLEGRLDFTGPGIRQTSSAIQDDGRIRWTVEMQDAVRGQYVLAAAATLPPPANGIVLAPDIRFEQSGTEPDEFSDVNVQQSFAVLVNLSSAQMVPTAGQTHEVVQKENLPLVLRNELVAQAMEMARLHSGEELSWQMQRVTEQMTATATVMLADLQTMLAADGSWRTQASYRVRNRGHQFLAVRLPSEARLLSVMVKDQPSRVSRTMLNDEPVLLVPLPQTSAADLSFNAVLVLQGQFARSLPRTMAVSGEHFSLPVPSIVTPNESPDYGVPVFHTSWKVTLPDEFAASPVEGDLTTVEYQPSGTSDLYALDQTLQELAELNRLLGDSRASYSQRSLAAGNLKKLESELEEQSERGYFYLGSLPSSKQEELAQEKEHLLSESRQNTAQFQQEYSDSLGVVDRDGDGVIEVPQLSNRAFINSNGIMIQQDNNDFSTSSQEHLGTANTFRFNVTPEPAADDKVPGRSRGKSSPAPQRRTRSELMDDLTRQESLFGNAPSDDAPQSGESEFWRQSELTEGFVDRPTSTPLQGGRGGFGGGGFGGERGFDRLNISGFAIQNLGDDAASFTPTGGLSLPIDIPVAGETLTFTRVGGNPALTLAIRPRESVSYGLRWLWTLVWVALGGFVLSQLTSRQHSVNWGQITGIGCLLLGLFSLLLMPSPAAWIGLPVILIGCLLTLGSPQRTAN